MPATKIVFYQEQEGGAVPVVDWLNELKRKNPKGFLKRRLQQFPKRILSWRLREKRSLNKTLSDILTQGDNNDG